MQESTLTEISKKRAIAKELTDINIRQKAITLSNSKIGPLVKKSDRDIWYAITLEDEKNSRMIDTMMADIGVRVPPKESTRLLTDLALDIISREDSTMLEKLETYDHLRNDQMSNSHLLQKVMQLAKKDVKDSLKLIEAMHTSMAKQMTQVTKLVEKSVVETIMGEEPSVGVIERARDAALNAAGSWLGKKSKTAEDMSVLNLLQRDHIKVQTLIQEAENTRNPQMSRELIQQLRLDLITHMEAEEQTIYRAFESFRDLREYLESSKDDHEEIRASLDALSDLKPGTENFDRKLQDLKFMLNQHIEDEEDELFRTLRSKVTEMELVRLAGEFLKAKEDIQIRLNREQLQQPELIAMENQPQFEVQAQPH